MTLLVPTAGELKARYPEFTDVSDPTVSLFINDAKGMVDDSWVETDQKPAISALAAHLMASEGYPARTSGAFNAGKDGRTVRSRKVGDVETTYERSGSDSSSGSAFLSNLSTTPYGRRFAQLLKLNTQAVDLL